MKQMNHKSIKLVSIFVIGLATIPLLFAFQNCGTGFSSDFATQSSSLASSEIDNDNNNDSNNNDNNNDNSSLLDSSEQISEKAILTQALLCEKRLAKYTVDPAAFFVPASAKLTLQAALTKYKSVRLEPFGDYRLPNRAGTPENFIRISTGQSIYSVGGTQIPKLIINAGTKDALISGVNASSITFSSGAAIQGNCINRIINTAIIGTKISLVNNRFSDLSNTRIDINNSGGGAMINNIFIRTMIHGPTPSIRLLGNSVTQSTGNKFIWTNILNSSGDGIIINGFNDIAFIGLDAETWNASGKATLPAMMNVTNTNKLDVFISSGGSNRPNAKFFQLDAASINLFGMHIAKNSSEGLTLGKNVKDLISLATKDIGLKTMNPKTHTYQIYRQNINRIMDNHKAIPATSHPYNSLVEISTTPVPVVSGLSPPVFNQINDPAGPNWNRDLIRKTDSSKMIQDLVNKKGIAELPAGIYYINKPILLNNNQGIKGAGAHNTAIIAMSPNIDIIRNNNRLSGVYRKTANYYLSDITLQGGLNGINQNGAYAGMSADYTLTKISHVTMRNMKNSCIAINNIYAWDNNFIDYVQFYRCNTAIQQRPNPSYKGGDAPGMTFLDKNVFFRNQFVENNIALDWPSVRANGLNACFECEFRDNVMDLHLINSPSSMFVNSVFRTPSKNPILTSNYPAFFIDTYFVNLTQSNLVAIGTSPLFKDNSSCYGCTFQNSRLLNRDIVSSTGRNNFIIKSIEK